MHINEWVKLMSNEVKLSVAETPWGGTNLIAKDKVHKGDIVLQIRFQVFSECDRPQTGHRKYRTGVSYRNCPRG